ncbi:hypothetical protein SAMN05421870_105202 [Streptomyces qinglanensis]|uniref:Uncharacterized protein n=1 Tax=Streptomyces qinglanensis TaxID=943816 RepID=A0A1H9T084_9ACTN|nr:hypothetical protein SAMN05421870_105202 [Streptomyces qinglanensis]
MGWSHAPQWSGSVQMVLGAREVQRARSLLFVARPGSAAA